MNTDINKIAAAHNALAAEILASANSSSIMRGRITRELIRQQAAESNISNLLAAIVKGLMDGEKEPHLAAFCAMARAEVEACMESISKRHPARRPTEAEMAAAGPFPIAE